MLPSFWQVHLFVSTRLQATQLLSDIFYVYKTNYYTHWPHLPGLARHENIPLAKEDKEPVGDRHRDSQR